VSEADDFEGARPPGSPAAQRFDPPVRASRWLAPQKLAWDEVVEDVFRAAELDHVATARLLAHGGLWLDQKPAPLEAPPSQVAAGVHVAVYALGWDPEILALGDDAILHDERGVVVVNKPAWLPVQATRASRLQSLEAVLRAKLDCPELRAAHRLDRQTSGVVLFARDAERAAFLGKALMDRRVERTYLAWVSPPPASDSWKVSGPLGPARTPPRFRFELRARPDKQTKPSETEFSVLKRVGERALVECRPHTGRTHQLRVHLAHGGTPIVGDDLYGAPYRAGAVTSAERVQLHAERLRARLAPKGPEVELCAPLPADFL
jgi:RluA family pseudouridine synthase